MGYTLSANLHDRGFIMSKMSMRKAAIGLLAFALASAPVFAHCGGWHDAHFGGRYLVNSSAWGQMGLIGDWIYYDSNYIVEIDFDRDGDMEIKMRNRNQTETEWEGFWTATSEQISFNIVKKEVKNLSSPVHRKTTERLSETWTISYSLSADGKLTLSCANLPDIMSSTVYQRD